MRHFAQNASFCGSWVIIKCQKSNSRPHLEESVSCITFYWYINVSLRKIEKAKDANLAVNASTMRLYHGAG
jgi:hypothetical protein